MVAAFSVVNNARRSEWDDILAWTREMLSAATAGDWDRTTRLEQERRARILRFFETAPADYEAPWVRSGIQEILQSDDRLLELCQSEKAQASAEIIDLRHGAAARQAYRQTAAG